MSGGKKRRAVGRQPSVLTQRMWHGGLTPCRSPDSGDAADFIGPLRSAEAAPLGECEILSPEPDSLNWGTEILKGESPAGTPASKATAGITVPGTHVTPSGPPSTTPVGQIQALNRLEHTIRFSDSATATTKAKPPGVRGCQVCVKIGTTPPASESDLHFLATDTRTPYIAQFDPADAGKTAYCWLRWENNKGETGPWSAPVSATITG